MTVPSQPQQHGRPRGMPSWQLAAIAAVVGGLAVLLFTGLVAPGFFLAKPEPGPRRELPASMAGGETRSAQVLLDTRPYETVRKIYSYIAQNVPEQVCGRFTTEAGQQFADHHGAVDCAAAVAKLHAQIDKTAGARNAYAEPDFHGMLLQVPDEDSIDIDSCTVGVRAGPRLGVFTLNRVEHDQWIITQHRAEVCS